MSLRVLPGRLPLLVLVVCLAAVGAVLTGGALATDGASQADDATVEFEQTTTGNVFLADETATVGLESDAATVVWTLERYDGERVANGTVAVDGETHLTLPVEAVGQYELLAWPAGAADDPSSTTVAVLPADGFDNEDTFYGFSTHFAAGWDHDLMPILEAAGAATARDEHGWARVEQSRGRYDFSGPVQAGFMEKLRDRDLQRLFLLSYGNPVYGGEWNNVPHNDSYRRAFGNYSRAVLDRYEALDYVEVWNEPNLDTYGSGPAAQDPAAYAALLEATHAAVNEERSDVTVVGGSIAGVSDEGNRFDFAFMEGVLAAGGADAMDAMSVHPYRPRPTNYSTDFERLRNLTREYNDGEALPIWVTEFGWRTGPDGGVTQSTQARYLVRSHVGLRAADIERAYWYTFRDDAPPNADEDRYPFGLLRHPDDPAGAHTPKPSLAAYATMTRQLAGADSVTEQPDAPVTAYQYGPEAGSEAGDGERTTVLWVSSDLDTTDVTLRVTDPVTVTTMTGERRRLVPQDGEVYLTVGTDPLYVAGEIDRIERGAPVSITGTTNTLDVGAIGDDGDRTVIHEIAGNRVEVTAEAGSDDRETIDVPTAYRPLRPENADVFYFEGGQRVDDVVWIDGDPVGLLSTRVQPDSISPTADLGAPEGTETTASRTATATADGEETDGGTTDGTPSTTTSARGPGFDVGAVLAAVAILLTTVATAAKGRRRSR